MIFDQRFFESQIFVKYYDFPVRFCILNILVTTYFYPIFNRLRKTQAQRNFSITYNTLLLKCFPKQLTYGNTSSFLYSKSLTEVQFFNSNFCKDIVNTIVCVLSVYFQKNIVIGNTKKKFFKKNCDIFIYVKLSIAELQLK